MGVAALVARYEAEGRLVPALLRAAVEAGGFYPSTDTVLGSDGAVRERRRVEGVLTVAEAERNFGVLAESDDAAVVDLGDGIACLALRTFVSLLDAGDADGIRGFARRGQAAFHALRNAEFPVVAAARGLALGGGNELMLIANRIVAHAELYAGFPERSVGLIPAWGGVAQSLARAVAAGEGEAAASAFEVTSSCEVSTSAWQAGDWHLLRQDDLVVASARRVLAEAKAAALALVEGGWTPPALVDLPLHSPEAEPLDAGWDEASETDRAIVARIAGVLTGDRPGATASEEELLPREVDAAVDLLQLPKNQERVWHLLKTNKPLGN
ncbi:hypothetical protein H5397_16020 [Propioniciclava sp. MC1683]|uniref:enoyl-CoA hydratase/isomerase family protein n=1 Tax=Propioniciclava sp. MC1683 TaxID=2760309 RepID=UPI00160134EF|nr:enoyl-CoA hydratase-related protein [Propioniciclava sp. MC1683]MBB1502908.1 hypothetical protein [Propioniciclava sp. MC1683]